MTRPKAKAEEPTPAPVGEAGPELVTKTGDAVFVEPTRPGFVLMRHDDLPGTPTAEVGEAAVPFHLSRGWVLVDPPLEDGAPPADDTNPPAGDTNTTTPEV